MFRVSLALCLQSPAQTEALCDCVLINQSKMYKTPLGENDKRMAGDVIQSPL